MTRTWKKPCNAATYRAAALDAARAEPHGVVVEVGVFAGLLSRMLATLPDLKRLILVDPWRVPYSGFDQDHMDAVAANVMEWAATEPKVEVMRMPSHEAAPLFADESIDFWHTDGDHTTEMVKLDITSWLPKVKTGRLMTGDNYEAPSVAAGVDALLPHRYMPEAAKGRLWCARKL